MQAIDFQEALLEELEDLPVEAMPNLIQIVHLYKESVLAQSQKAIAELQVEFEEWDRLSDEALLEFKKRASPRG
ncbi:MAG: hypothetical protein ACP5JJ_04660 [Anaerolineae bacterium]